MSLITIKFSVVVYEEYMGILSANLYVQFYHKRDLYSFDVKHKTFCISALCCIKTVKGALGPWQKRSMAKLIPSRIITNTVGCDGYILSSKSIASFDGREP